MKAEIVIIYVIGTIIVLAGTYFSYREARKDRFSFHKKKLLIPFSVSLIQTLSFLTFGQVQIVLANHGKWYVPIIIIVPFILNFICMKLGYRKKKLRIFTFGYF